MKKIKWFPFNKVISIIFHVMYFCGCFLLLLLCIIITAITKNIVNFFVTFDLFVFIFLILSLGSILLPLSIKIKKDKVILNISLLNKRVISSNCIAFTQFIYNVGPYHRSKPTFRDYDIENAKKPNEELTNNFTFVIYNNNAFVDKTYLRDEKGELLFRQESINFFVNTIDNKNNILIDGTYKNYKYLRQFFDVAQFRDTRGTVQNMIEEYEAKLQQEKTQAGS